VQFSNARRQKLRLELDGSAFEPQRTQRISQRNAEESFFSATSAETSATSAVQTDLKIRHLEF
jgi:hypothetical protein